MGKKKKRHDNHGEPGITEPIPPAEDTVSAPPTEGADSAPPVIPGEEPDGASAGSTELVEPAAEATRRLQAELDAANDRYLRLAAEFDNFRKRMQRERAETTVRAQGQLAEKVLEGLDNLGRVVELDTERATVADVLDGVRLVERKLLQELESAGLTRVGGAGEPFDPNHHEAVGALPAPVGEEPGTVGAVLQPGYLFNAVLLRPARVMVYVAPEVPDGSDGNEG